MIKYLLPLIVLAGCAGTPPVVEQKQIPVIQKKLVVDKIKSVEDIKALFKVLNYSWTYPAGDAASAKQMEPIKNFIE